MRGPLLYKVVQHEVINVWGELNFNKIMRKEWSPDTWVFIS